MGAKILVADDSATIQTVIELSFSGEDVELIPARSGEEAIRRAKESNPDLMLIDAVMPDTSGYEVCRTLKADPAMRDVPVILLVGSFESVDRLEGMTVGASDFLTKPFQSQILITKVKQLLDARAMRLSSLSATEGEIAAMEEEPLTLQLEEAASPSLEGEPALIGSVTPPVTPPPLAVQESSPPLSEKPDMAPAQSRAEPSQEFARELLERAVTNVAEQSTSQMAKDVTERLVEQIERERAEQEDSVAQPA